MTNKINQETGQNIEEQKIQIDYRRIDIELQRLNIEERKIANEEYRSQLDRSKIINDVNIKGMEAVVRFAEITLRSLLILNGGAALGFITFATAKMKDGRFDGAGSIVLTFGFGAALAVLCAGMSYLAQLFFSEPVDKDAHRWIGRLFRYIAIGSAVVSWVLFIVGVWLIYDKTN